MAKLSEKVDVKKKAGSLKKGVSEFKAFIMRGNILDMAIGVIIGSAFSAIVTAFTNGIKANNPNIKHNNFFI